MADVNATAKKIIANVETVVVGKRQQIILALASWFSEGHVLLEDVPGVAKTVLARALAASVGCSFKRIQCTPDLLPTDVTGTSVFNPKTTEFEFRAGPIFAQIVLADEINRATPRTQAALLEAMAESRVTVDGTTYVLKPPFLVIGTQNPIDHEGTFPLPEAQLDRFLMRFSLGYPNFEQELKMLEVLEREKPLTKVGVVATADELVACQQAVRAVHVDEKLRHYLMEIIHKTRENEHLALGASPRASLAMFRASQAMAAILGRDYVQPDDLKRVAPHVLGHRLIVRPEARLRQVTAAAVLEELIADIRVPIPNVEPELAMRWLFWASLLLVLSLILGLGLLAYAMYALLGVLLLSRLLARVWVRNLSAERECNQQTAQVGDTIAVVVTVINSGRLPIAWLLLEDVLPRKALLFEPPNLRVVGRRMKLCWLGRGGRVAMYYQLQCNRRGFYQIGPLVMETGDLFGLHRRFRVGSQPHFLLVYPQVIPLSGYEIASRRPIGEIRISHRLFEDPTRIAGVRAYQSGDPMNRIHWRATARTGQLHSKIYEPSSIAGATIVLDFHANSYPSKDEPFRSELAITAAASLANALYEMGQQVGLVSNCRDAVDRIRQEGWDVDLRSRKAAQRLAGMHETSDRLRPVTVETRRGSEQLVRILETLARAELTDGLTFSQLIADHAKRLPRDATVVAILTQLTDEKCLALSDLRRRGFAVSVILNLHDGWEFAGAAGALGALGIGAYHLASEQAVTDVCRNYLTAGAPPPAAGPQKPLRIAIE